MLRTAEHQVKLPPVLLVTGPTAVGKTALCLELARRVGGEILSADSRQIYEGLTIGTAKPHPQEMLEVPHHFVGELPLEVHFSAGRFAEAANERIDAVQHRGRQPIVTGGSTLWIYALQFGLAEIPPVEETVRDRMAHRLEREGAEALFRELQEIDPAAAETMDATKTQRLLRALEVYHGTGRPLTYYHENQPEPPHRFATVVLHRERSELYDRINRRVDRMLDHGLLDEVRALLERGVDPAQNALRTIGYREPVQYLRGEIDRAEMIRLIKRNTRRYAKRQLSWFRRHDFPRIDATAPVEEQIDRVLAEQQELAGDAS